MVRLTKILVDAVDFQKLHRQQYLSSDFHLLPLLLSPHDQRFTSTRFTQKFMNEIEAATARVSVEQSEVVALAAFGLGRSRRKKQASGEAVCETEVLLKADVLTTRWLG